MKQVVSIDGLTKYYDKMTAEEINQKIDTFFSQDNNKIYNDATAGENKVITNQSINGLKNEINNINDENVLAEIFTKINVFTFSYGTGNFDDPAQGEIRTKLKSYLNILQLDEIKKINEDWLKSMVSIFYKLTIDGYNADNETGNKAVDKDFGKITDIERRDPKDILKILKFNKVFRKTDTGEGSWNGLKEQEDNVKKDDLVADDYEGFMNALISGETTDYIGTEKVAPIKTNQYFIRKILKLQKEMLNYLIPEFQSILG